MLPWQLKQGPGRPAARAEGPTTACVDPAFLLSRGGSTLSASESRPPVMIPKDKSAMRRPPGRARSEFDSTIIIPAPNHYHRFPFDLLGHGGGRRAEGRVPKVSNIPISNTQKGCQAPQSNHMHWEMTRNRARRARSGLLGPFSMSAGKHMSAAPRALRRPAAESLPFPPSGCGLRG